MASPSVTAGPYVVGERPDPLSYTFQNSSGVAVNLTGFTAKFIVKDHTGSPATYNATVSTPASGIVTYAWTGDEYPAAGDYEAEFWTGNGSTLKYCSILIKFNVRRSVGPAPSI